MVGSPGSACIGPEYGCGTAGKSGLEVNIATLSVACSAGWGKAAAALFPGRSSPGSDEMRRLKNWKSSTQADEKSGGRWLHSTNIRTIGVDESGDVFRVSVGISLPLSLHEVACSNFLLTHMGNKTCASNVTGQLDSWRCICVSRSGSEG
jgi:hypothetical protein